ncbi:MAG TPA: glucose-6-phosphate dehydrogenase [Coriobacteriia bacterium]|jgi:glucose-6-phosphate 1-dehydrogenase
MPAEHTPTVLVVFGATGDLMSRKIVPALFHLFERDRLPERFRVVGFARRPFPDDVFRRDVASYIERHGDVMPPQSELERFLGMFTYQRGQFEEEAAYVQLDEDLKRIDSEWETCSNKLFYLAVPPEYYRAIFERLAASGLSEPCSDESGWTRVLVEKPFGKDAHTAQQLDELLGSLFREEQIYRIDHYLAKEMLQGIINFRFSNNLLEPTWDARGIDKIEVSLLETVGVEDRGDFYDGVGALRDVGQNHLLQMLALVTMDQPSDLGAEAIRMRRAELLESLRRLSPSEVSAASYRAQYEGYRGVPGVAPDSQTETYFKLQTYIENARWAGVPITMQAGKRVGEARKEIVVTFKHAQPCLCEDSRHYENRVIFTLEPVESIRIEFFTKKPGFERELERRDFNFFLYEKEAKEQYVEEYSRLLSDAVAGDQTLFVSTAEVKAMWEFTDPVEETWASGKPPLHPYKPDTDEPLRAAAHIGRGRTIFPGRDRNEIGILGLGKMGGGLARRLAEHDWRVVAWNRHVEVAEELAAEEPHAVVATSVAELVARLTPPRLVWMMLPAGDVVENEIFGEGGLTSLLQPGDIIVDGGNSFYKDSVCRGQRLEDAGFVFADVGVSGGPAGARWGACLMVGGKRETFERLTPLWHDLAREGAYRHFEGYGAGHFVKMVHNGIEYGMMQALAEGFTVLKRSAFDPDLTRVAEIYDNGSVIESRLVGWLHDAFERHGEDLAGVSGAVAHTGEGEWTVRTAEEEGVWVPVIADALRFRVESTKDGQSYTGKILAALREAFGGHSISGGPG